MKNNDELQVLRERWIDLPEMGYWDYEWDEFASFYDPVTRMFYWLEGSGCSCNYLWEDVNSVGDLSVGRKEELLSAAASFSDGRYDSEFQELRNAVSKIQL